MARAFAYCLKVAPAPKWYTLYNAIQSYGVPAVFGRDTLYPQEIRAMNTTYNIINAFQSREASKDWGKWEEAHPQHAEFLALAAEQYKKWQNEYR